MKKLAIVTSHPIQYNAPLFRLLTQRKRLQVKVFYSWGQTQAGQVYDPDFKKSFSWDIPLLDGYEKEFIENISTNPGAGHFSGIKNKELISRIKAFQPDAILVYGWSFHSHLQVLRAFSGKVKLLFRGDSNLLDETQGFSAKKIVRRLFLRWVYSYVDVAVYTGRANKEYYLAHGLSEQQLKYAGHAVDNARFAAEEQMHEQAAFRLRTEMGIGAQELVFLFAGKLEPKKDPATLIRAFSAIEQTDIRLIIVGNGKLEQELKQQAQNDQRILFLDFQNQQQMPVIYRLCNVFVLPSAGPGETWGLSVNEAMACSRAVLVSNKCGCAEDLVTAANGMVFEAGNVDDLKKAMHYFAENKKRTAQMGLAGSMRIKDFSQEAIAKAIEETI
ncbi:MAG: glycosyltransferase family 4 protein [Lacibacter sp.]